MPALMSGITNADLKHYLIINSPETTEELMSTFEIYITSMSLEVLGGAQKDPGEESRACPKK